MVLTGCKKDSSIETNSTNNLPTDQSAYKGTGSITQGLSATADNAIYSCTGGRVTNLGNIISTNNKTWILPGENNFKNGTKLFDLYIDKLSSCIEIPSMTGSSWKAEV